jgi:hypothetical protein
VSFTERSPEVRYIEGLETRREALRDWDIAEFEELRREAWANQHQFTEGVISQMGRVVDSNSFTWAPESMAYMESSQAPVFGIWCCSSHEGGLPQSVAQDLDSEFADDVEILQYESYEPEAALQNQAAEGNTRRQVHERHLCI